jgi:hypothetical protein
VRLAVLLVLQFSLILTGCGYRQLYPGESLPREQVARVIIKASRAQIFLDGQEKGWFDQGYEVLPGEHVISGTIYARRNRVCGALRQSCYTVMVNIYGRRGRIVGRRPERRCNCYQDCTEDEYRALCSATLNVTGGEERIFRARIAEEGSGESPQIRMTLDEGKYTKYVQCDETQFGGKVEFRISVACLSL